MKQTLSNIEDKVKIMDAYSAVEYLKFIDDESIGIRKLKEKGYHFETLDKMLKIDAYE